MDTMGMGMTAGERQALIGALAALWEELPEGHRRGILAGPRAGMIPVQALMQLIEDGLKQEALIYTMAGATAAEWHAGIHTPAIDVGW